MDGDSTTIALAGIAATALVGVAVPLIQAFFAARREDTQELREVIDDASRVLGIAIVAQARLHDKVREARRADDREAAKAAWIEVIERVHEAYAIRMDLLVAFDRLRARLPITNPIVAALARAVGASSPGAGEIGDDRTDAEEEEFQNRVNATIDELDDARADFADAARRLTKTKVGFLARFSAAR